MTVGTTVTDLLGLVGLEDPVYASDQMKERILSDINATLQVIWTMVPPWWSVRQNGRLVNAPFQVATGISIVKGAKVATTNSFPRLPEWSEGCTIRLGDDAEDNEVVRRDVPGNLSFELMRPYAGSSLASVGTATVYNDAFDLDAQVAGVQPPVVLLGERELLPLRGERDLRVYAADTGHRRTSYHDIAGGLTVVGNRRDVDVPIGYYVESVYVQPPANEVRLRLRLTPLPANEGTLQFEERLTPPRVVSLANSAEIVPLPQGMFESVFLPMVRMQFSTQKHFESSQLRPVLKAQADQAFQLLAKLKPQSARIGAVSVDTANR
jgi:hypothetical protein